MGPVFKAEMRDAGEIWRNEGVKKKAGGADSGFFLFFLFLFGGGGVVPYSSPDRLPQSRLSFDKKPRSLSLSLSPQRQRMQAGRYVWMYVCPWHEPVGFFPSQPAELSQPYRNRQRENGW